MPRILQPIPTPVFMDTTSPNYLENLQTTITMPTTETTSSLANLYYLTSNITTYNHIEKNNTPNLIFSNSKTWILIIEDNKILFNTQELTIDEITKEFLKRLSEITHTDGLQYTFDF